MTTQIADNLVVSFNYTLKDEQGNILDQSPEGHPLPYLHGASNIVPGLENAMTGKKVGDKFSVHVPASQAYGEYNPDLVDEVPREMFQGVDTIEIGMQFQAQTDHGVQIVTVKGVEDDKIIVDANFPLAGQDLNFDIEIVDIREATQEELDHGHVHGVGGHQH